MERIGVVGVGYIGKGFVEALLEADYAVTVYDVDEAKLDWARERGANAADSPAAVAAAVECVIAALPGTPEVETVMGGEDGVLAAAADLDLVIDASTTLPETSVECEALCETEDVLFLEAPITGGSPREGMHVVAGGTVASYEAAGDVLDAICADHVRIGEAGDATVFKLGLQLRYAGHNAVDAEVVEFLRDAGVDPRPLVDFLEFDVWERYFTGDFSQDIEGMGGLAIWHKDLGYLRRVAAERDTALPLAGVLHEAYKATSRQVDEDEGHAAALVNYWLALNDAEYRYE